MDTKWRQIIYEKTGQDKTSSMRHNSFRLLMLNKRNGFFWDRLCTERQTRSRTHSHVTFVSENISQFPSNSGLPHQPVIQTITELVPDNDLLLLWPSGSSVVTNYGFRSSWVVGPEFLTIKFVKLVYLEHRLRYKKASYQSKMAPSW